MSHPMKTKSAVTGQYTTAKAAKAKPKETYVSDDYPARMLRKLIKALEQDLVPMHIKPLIANIKKRMGWTSPIPGR